jgi:penicillin-binding protein 2
MSPSQLGSPRLKIPSANRRLQLWYGVLLLIIGLIIIRLFYLQIIRHDHYKEAAYADQLKQYSVAADRGLIEAHEGADTVPLVLNQKLYTLYVDPTLTIDIKAGAEKLAAITHGKAAEYAAAMQKKPSRYQVLA